MLWVYRLTIYRMTRAFHREGSGIDRFEMKISLQHTEVWSVYGGSEVDCGRVITKEWCLRYVKW
jgi:hypothetical protein